MLYCFHKGFDLCVVQINKIIQPVLSKLQLIRNQNPERGKQKNRKKADAAKKTIRLEAE